jgi:hypothetical protein
VDEACGQQELLLYVSCEAAARVVYCWHVAIRFFQGATGFTAASSWCWVGVRQMTLTCIFCMYLDLRRASCRPPYGTAKCASEEDSFAMFASFLFSTYGADIHFGCSSSSTHYHSVAAASILCKHVTPFPVWARFSSVQTYVVPCSMYTAQLNSRLDNHIARLRVRSRQ